MVTNKQEAKEFKDASGKAFRAKPAPIAGANPGAVEVIVTSRHGAEFSPKQPVYAAERRLRLLQIFAGVDRRVANGWSTRRALRAAARRWKGRTFRSAPGREVDFSADTLERLFYSWRKFGDSALDLHYVAPARLEVPPAVTKEVLQRAGQADVLSFSQLFKSVYSSSATALPSPRTLGRAIPDDKRHAISEVLRARRAAIAKERQAKREADRAAKRARAELERAERAARKVLG